MRTALALCALVVAAASAGCSLAGGEESSAQHVLELRNERAEEIALHVRVVHEGGEVVFDDAVVLAPGAVETRGINGLTGTFNVVSSTPGSNLDGDVLLVKPGSTLHVTVTSSGIVPSTTQAGSAAAD